MQTLKTIRNVIIILVSGFVSLILLNYVKTNGDIENQTTNNTEYLVNEELPSDNTFRSLKGIDIKVDNIKSEGTVVNPIKIIGSAPGYWFFEGTAPVVLTKWDGTVISESKVNAVGDWMTTEYVPFEGEILYPENFYGEYGFLTLKKDNPSGLSENDDFIEIKILLK